MKTIGDFQDAMRKYEDCGVALQVQDAIANLKIRDEFDSDELTFDNLERIRQEIYRINKSPDPITTLFDAMIGKTNNPIEASLQYIESLQNKIRDEIK